MSKFKPFSFICRAEWPTTAVCEILAKGQKSGFFYMKISFAQYSLRLSEAYGNHMLD